MKKYFILPILIIFTFTCAAQEEIIDITDQETYDYWELDVSKMSKKHPGMPKTELYDGGAIQFKYTFLIDANGRPRDFKFISAEPKSAEIEQDKLRKITLFRRYIRNPKSTYRGATRVHADEKWWKPDQSTITFPTS